MSVHTTQPVALCKRGIKSSKCVLIWTGEYEIIQCTVAKLSRKLSFTSNMYTEKLSFTSIRPSVLWCCGWRVRNSTRL